MATGWNLLAGASLPESAAPFLQQLAARPLDTCMYPDVCHFPELHNSIHPLLKWFISLRSWSVPVDFQWTSIGLCSLSVSQQ
jgi:hypothetical protein